MKKRQTPPQSIWSSEFFYVGFKDECKYHVRGWERMGKTTHATRSCRHRCDPKSGTCGPPRVWSSNAGRHDIID